MSKFWNIFSWALPVGFLCGFGIGLAMGYDVVRGVSKDWNEKIDIENACIAGNSNACRVYEVRYGR